MLGLIYERHCFLISRLRPARKMVLQFFLHLMTALPNGQAPGGKQYISLYLLGRVAGYQSENHIFPYVFGISCDFPLFFISWLDSS